MEENLEESLHELVRGNVLTATRYFEHRVKQFINKIMMGKNNPMHIKFGTNSLLLYLKNSRLADGDRNKV